MCRKDILRSEDKVFANNSQALKLGILQQRCSFILFSYIIFFFVLKPTLCLCSVTIFTAGATSQGLDDSCGVGRRKTADSCKGISCWQWKLSQIIILKSKVNFKF